MSFCKNCGTDIGNDKFCVNCGQSNVTILEKEMIPNCCEINTPSSIKYKNLSFIVISVLSLLSILLLFLKGYFKYYSLNVGSYYADDFYKSASYFDLADSVVIGIFAILLLVAPIVIYIVNLKLPGMTKLYWVGFASECAGFLYVLISSLILSNNFDYVNTGSNGNLHYGYLRRFENFEFLFYIELIIIAVMIIITVFDALGKPLIKIKKRGIRS